MKIIYILLLFTINFRCSLCLADVDPSVVHLIGRFEVNHKIYRTNITSFTTSYQILDRLSNSLDLNLFGCAFENIRYAVNDIFMQLTETQEGKIYRIYCAPEVWLKIDQLNYNSNFITKIEEIYAASFFYRPYNREELLSWGITDFRFQSKMPEELKKLKRNQDIWMTVLYIAKSDAKWAGVKNEWSYQRVAYINWLQQNQFEYFYNQIQQIAKDFGFVGNSWFAKDWL